MSKIEWTGLTWNPTTGCDKVSAGCKFCYAEVMHRRLRAMGQKKYNHRFLGEVQVHTEELDVPRDRKKPTVYFVNSMSDLFHGAVPFWFIHLVFEVMRECPQHTFQVLTKRPEIAVRFYDEMGKKGYPVPDNVWIGTSVENQEQAEIRIPYLIQIPAAVRFLSCEPLLGEINFMKYAHAISWVISGGESGNKKGVRPMHPSWPRFLRDQCKAMHIPYFFKQWGSYQQGSQTTGPNVIVLKDGRHKDYWTNIGSNFTAAEWRSLDPQAMGRVGKKLSGNLLDGQQHLEMPTV